MIRQWLRNREEQKKIGNVATWIKHHVESRLHESDFKFGTGYKKPPDFWFYDRDGNRHTVYKVDTPASGHDPWIYVYKNRGICELTKAEVKMIRSVHDKLHTLYRDQEQKRLQKERETAMVDALSKLM